MNQGLPIVTVLIPARAIQADIKAVAAAKSLDYPKDRLEILVARGNQPSAQRNAGLRAASGELVYFLDDDSVPGALNLREAARHFQDSNVQMVGGPNLCPRDAPPLEQVFALVLTAWLAFGPSRARYAPVGTIRPSGEKELILCNLLSRKAPLLELGGFNEELYPNEENALMDELQKRGGILLYDPAFTVFRRPRPTMKAFCKMLMTYGRGRAEQFRLHPTLGSILNFIPPAFVLYLLSLSLLPLIGSIWLLPLAAYLLAVLVQTFALIASGGMVRGIAASPLVVLTHVLYGVGFWSGLFGPLNSRKRRHEVQVALEKIQ